jgi:4-oxalocrotonate tautomerase
MEKSMPTIRVEMFAGRTYEQKQALAKKLTEAFTEAAGGRPEAVHVLFFEVEKQHWAVAGELFSDRDETTPALR